MWTTNLANGLSVLLRVISSYESSIVCVTVIMFVRQTLAPLLGHVALLQYFHIHNGHVLPNLN
jgi:hypothetical protein